MGEPVEQRTGEPLGTEHAGPFEPAAARCVSVARKHDDHNEGHAARARVPRQVGNPPRWQRDRAAPPPMQRCQAAASRAAPRLQRDRFQKGSAWSPRSYSMATVTRSCIPPTPIKSSRNPGPQRSRDLSSAGEKRRADAATLAQSTWTKLAGRCLNNGSYREPAMLGPVGAFRGHIQSLADLMLAAK